jgi:hypothetical protein
VAEHPVLAGRAQLSVLPEHGPGAALRNARKRYAGTVCPIGQGALPGLAVQQADVEVRDLAIYDTLLGTSAEDLREAA